jgi:hypothetical protein
MKAKKIKNSTKPTKGENKPEKLLPLREVAKLFGVSTATITNHDAILKPIKVFGGHRRYRESIVNEVLAKMINH